MLQVQVSLPCSLVEHRNRKQQGMEQGRASSLEFAAGQAHQMAKGLLHQRVLHYQKRSTLLHQT
jgi:hypothetical protein